MIEKWGSWSISEHLKQVVMSYVRLRCAAPGKDVAIPIDKPPGPRVLVLAPHPDDELIGCGGTLHKHCLAGDEVVCLYLTNGEASSGFAHLDRNARGELRAYEARKGAKIIGIQNLIFLHQKDSDLQPSEEIVSAVAQHIRDFRPNVVYLPFFFEKHPDHFQTNRILEQVYLRVFGALDFRCAAYETTTPLIPNCIVAIDELASLKRLALEQHRVALDAMNIIDTTLGLNRWRSLETSGGRGYAEAYLHVNARDYFDLLESVFPLLNSTLKSRSDGLLLR